MLDKNDGRYLADLVRRTAGIRSAIVREVGADNRYSVEFVDNGGFVWAVAAQPSVIYRAGQEVSVQVDLSGRSAGKLPQIIGVAQSSANGRILVSRSSRSGRSAETVTQYPVAPVQLPVGGLPKRLAFFGFGLTTPPTYGHASIVNDVAAAVQGSSIVIIVKALAGCPKGRYSLTIAQQVVSNYFEVV